MSQITAIAQANEFQDFRLKPGEKGLYKALNKDSSIKYPIKVDIALPVHKVSLLLQFELGGVEFPSGDQFKKLQVVFNQEKLAVLQNMNRLIRCIVDCQLERQDSVGVRHALELARSFAAKVWDSSPLQLRQLDTIGNVSVRKLVSAGINSIEALEEAEAHKIEGIVGKQPPFGLKLLSQLEKFPKLRVSAKMVGKESNLGQSVKVRVRAEIGFVNEKPPQYFRKKALYVCFMSETSDGRMIDFRRMSAAKLPNGYDIFLSVELRSPLQSILCHVMCDEVAGSLRSAEIRPGLPGSLFPSSGPSQTASPANKIAHVTQPQEPNDFGDDELDDADLLAAGETFVVLLPREDTNN